MPKDSPHGFITDDPGVSLLVDSATLEIARQSLLAMPTPQFDDSRIILLTQEQVAAYNNLSAPQSAPRPWYVRVWARVRRFWWEVCYRVSTAAWVLWTGEVG